MVIGAKVEAQQFGVANASELVWFGILGLAHGQGNGFINYPVLIDSLASKKLSTTKLFSMDLGRQFSPGGELSSEYPTNRCCPKTIGVKGSFLHVPC